jgi:hypothetical protein
MGRSVEHIAEQFYSLPAGSADTKTYNSELTFPGHVL